MNRNFTSSRSINEHNRKRNKISICHFTSIDLFLKRFLIMWLLFGIGLYLVDVFMFTSTIKDIFSLPSDLVFLLAICNNISLIGAIDFKIRSLLITSILFDCILLVALPALIVEVIPNLLTYASLMLSIMLSIIYGVLYMKNNISNVDDDPSNLSYNYLNADRNSRSRLSYNCPRSIPMSQDTVLSISGNIPRHSCQF